MISMRNLLLALLHTAHSSFKTHHHLALENLALRQQLAMLKQSVKRPRVSPTDRLFWMLLSKYVEGWRTMLHALHPDTVVRWHRGGFRRYWRWKSRRRGVSRPPIDTEIRTLIRQMQSVNVGWRARRDNSGLRPSPLRSCRPYVTTFFAPFGRLSNSTTSICRELECLVIRQPRKPYR